MTTRSARLLTPLAGALSAAIAIGAVRPSAQTAAAPTPQQIFAEATAAYRDKAYATYLEKMRTLGDMRPTHPTIQYKLAGAYALNGRADDAARVLERLTTLQLVFDVRADDDFAAVRANVAVVRALDDMDAVRTRRIGNGTV